MSNHQLIEILKEYLLTIAQPELSKIHKYKDLHKAEDCYFFGNGISRKWFDMLYNIFLK